MYGRAGAEIPHEVEARTDEAAAGIGAVVIESQPVVDRQRRKRLPFILQIYALDLLRLLAVVDDAERDIARLHAVGIDGQDIRSRVAW